MTNLITLTIPNDDHIALRAFGKALEEMAREREPQRITVSPEKGEELTRLFKAEFARERLDAATAELMQAAPQMMDTLRFDGEELQGKRKEQCVHEWVHHVPAVIGKAEFDECNNCGEVRELKEGEESREGVPTTDKTGTPWDERIHSTSKALNADGTWRLRRKPSDKTAEEWADYIKWVEEDIHTVLHGQTKQDESLGQETTVNEVHQLLQDTNNAVTPPDDELGTTVDKIIAHTHAAVSEAYGPGIANAMFTGDSHKSLVNSVEPPVTPPGDDFHTDTSVVTEQTVAGIPPLPVPPPPVVVAPPVPEVTEWDFPRLMTFLTERHGKIDVATVNTLLAQDGLASLQELNAHPDKIGPFVSRVKAHLGE